MSASPPCSSFRGTHDISSEGVRNIVQEKLPDIRIPVPEWQDSGCLLADMGDYLLRSTHHLSQLADGVVNAHHVYIYIKQRVDNIEQENDFSDLETLDYLDEKHNSLKLIASHLETVAATIDNLWKDSRAPPSQEREEPSGFATDPIAIQRGVSQRMSPNEGPSTGYASNVPDQHDDSPESPVSDQDAQDSVIRLLEDLSKRGKGQYHCPYGDGCRKGGLDQNETQVVFERNSTFKPPVLAPLYQEGTSICSLIKTDGAPASKPARQQAQQHSPTVVPQADNAPPQKIRSGNSAAPSPMERGNGSNTYSPINRWYNEDKRVEPYHGIYYSSAPSAAPQESPRKDGNSDFDVSHAGSWVAGGTRQPPYSPTLDIPRALPSLFLYQKQSPTSGNMSATYSKSDYLIAGAGAFGASTALYLKRAYPDKTVTLVDRGEFPCPLAAAHDLNKIIRAEYEDIFYMKLALEALGVWRSDPVFSPHFNQTGILFNGVKGVGQTLVDNYVKLTGASPAELISPEDAKGRFNGVFRDADWTGVTICTWNPEAGWGDAANALKSVIQASIDLGVNYVSGSIEKITFAADGSATGLALAGGKILTGSKTILCTGAYTAELIADSAPEREEIQVNGRMVAAAAIMCAFKTPQDEMPKFEVAPIIISPLGNYPSESIPAGPQGLVKCTHERSFTNISQHSSSKQTFSMIPRRTQQMTWSQEVPQGLKDEMKISKNKIYGNWIEGLEPEYYRMCWDAVTPNQDFVISPHPKCENLYIATGGSFHGWKFLANIGKYVVQMLDGSLDPAAAQKWAWDRKDDGAACGLYLPARDLSDIEGYKEMVDAAGK
ncbi:hypothetical protein V492_01381 [Pseudogymnoascus sp. VKM F-4246]|nr:hypothetical protein V492_01381 [Pseudogymnoascus sp. VKM F-4246]